MKILQLSKKFPYPLKDGESIAIANMSKAMVELGAEVHLLSMNTSKHHVDVENAKKHLDYYVNIETVEVDNRLNVVDAFSNLIKGKSYHVARFDSEAYRKTLIRMLKAEEYDVIQLETMYLAPYLEDIREHSKAMVAMRAHNVEHEIWEKITENTSSFAKKWYLNHLSQKLKNYEIDYLNRYDFLVAITDADLEKFKRLGYKNGAIASPVGLNLNRYPLKTNSAKDKLSISFIGSLDWMPNLEGLQWFLDNVWTEVRKKAMPLEMHVAGRNTPTHISDLDNGSLKVLGEVDDAIDFIGRHPLMVVPLFSGSGIRVKILEGMAMGKVVITTSKGLEGIDAVSGKHVLVANDKQQFLDQLNWCLENRDQLYFIGQAAKKLVADEYCRTGIARKLLDSYNYVLSDEYSFS